MAIPTLWEASPTTTPSASVAPKPWLRFLSSQGISRSRLEALVSFGKTRPLVQTSAPELLNRRTVTEVSGFVKNHPTVLNGKYAAVVFREYVE